MLTVILVVAIILAVAILAVLGLAASRPNDFRVERAIAIQAPAEKIFPFIDDFRNWPRWSPYENKDPAMTRKLSGAATGPGAVYEWAGNKNVGAGRMEIVETTPPARIVIKLDFIRPFEGHNFAEFTLQPAGDATRVTWAIRGACNGIAKVMGLFFSMDRMIGKDFEAGLASLKAAAEK
jgi:uncharacterized protein YndB with AHSA1/START domain